jgi:uncharacterized membrane protein YsdA (DUF1294 family)
MSLELVVIAALLLADAIAWLAFRIDKARARRSGARRIRERTLLVLAVPGGVGALIAMYAHRRRHKVATWYFVVVVGAAALAQLALAGWLVAASV